MTQERKVAARLVPASSYGECLSKLTGGQVDAISTDDLILAGFASQQGNAVRFVNAPFSDEGYGVGIRQDDVSGCEDVNKAITRMYQDGTAGTLLKKWFGTTGLNLTDRAAVRGLRLRPARPVRGGGPPAHGRRARSSAPRWR